MDVQTLYQHTLSFAAAKHEASGQKVKGNKSALHCACCKCCNGNINRRTTIGRV